MMRLEWSPDALEDLDNIFDVITEDDPERAFSYIEEIREQAANLLYAPRSGIVIPEMGKEEFRERHYKMYTLVYEICEDSILIHEVYHQRRIHIRSYKRE